MMYAFMTTGTYPFLKQLEKDKRDLNFYFMKNSTQVLAYYENERKKNVFSAGRSYEILFETGQLQETGFIVMNNIPVTDDNRPVFEDRFRNRSRKIEVMPGFAAFRLLKPLKGNTYIVFTQWERKRDYELWRESEQFKRAHDDKMRKPAYFGDRPFLHTYYLIEEEE